MAKVALGSRLLYARSFHADGAPGLIVIHAGDEVDGPSLEVYSLPSLGLVMQVRGMLINPRLVPPFPTSSCMQTPLGSLMGQDWAPPPSGKASRLVAATRLGHLALLSRAGEVSLMALTKGIPAQQPSGGVYDWDLAVAAQVGHWQIPSSMHVLGLHVIMALLRRLR